MVGEKVRFQNEIYKVIFDYKNGMIEIQKVGRMTNGDVKLVRKIEVQVTEENQ